MKRKAEKFDFAQKKKKRGGGEDGQMCFENYFAGELKKSTLKIINS